MTIEEKHVVFRELAQQMGMQTARALLPEEIDICLNVAINDIVKELITSSVGYAPYNDKVARHNSAVSPINGLRTLYKKGDVIVSASSVKNNIIDISDTNVMIYTGFRVIYNDNTMYDCRIVEAEHLAQTLNDYCNRAAKDSPICTVSGDTNKISLEVYTGNSTSNTISKIQYLYIKNPAVVYYDENDINKCVNCDLPSYLHLDVVKRAVNVYLQSIGAVASNNKTKD